jgi:hypothetical protein
VTLVPQLPTVQFVPKVNNMSTEFVNVTKVVSNLWKDVYKTAQLDTLEMLN